MGFSLNPNPTPRPHTRDERVKQHRHFAHCPHFPQVRLAQVGLSIIDEEPREVVHLSMRRVRLDAVADGAKRHVTAKVGHLEIECPEVAVV